MVSSVKRMLSYHEAIRLLIRTLRGGPRCPCHLSSLQVIISTEQLFARVVGTPDQCLGIFTRLSYFYNLLELGIANLSSRKDKLSSTTN